MKWEYLLLVLTNAYISGYNSQDISKSCEEKSNLKLFGQRARVGESGYG